MGLQLFFAQKSGENELILSPEESRHAFKVLRHKAGDELHCIDGLGNMYKASIKSISEKNSLLEIKETTKDFGSHPWHLHMAVALLRNPDRYEWFVEKAVEIGVDEITPVISSRCEKKKINVERLNKIAFSALKQSQKSKMPVINEAMLYKDLIKRAGEDQKFIAHCDAVGARSWLHRSLVPRSPAVILIGPEGDFSPDEISAAKELKFKPIVISGSTLRTETAGVACCQIVSQVNSV